MKTATSTTRPHVLAEVMGVLDHCENDGCLGCDRKSTTGTTAILSHADSKIIRAPNHCQRIRFGLRNDSLLSRPLAKAFERQKLPFEHKAVRPIDTLQYE